MNVREHGTAQRRTPRLYTRIKDTGFPLDNPECIPYPNAGTIKTIQKCSTA
nr:MAG TPA: hypothetical protein [Caudoviricetes sp.]